MEELKIEGKPTSWQIYDNVKWLARLHEKKLSEVEEQVGVSKGYFSRCKSMNNSMSVDVVCKVAKLFGVSVDALLSEDFYMKHIRDAVIRKEFHLSYLMARKYFTDEELIEMVREFAKNPEDGAEVPIPTELFD